MATLMTDASGIRRTLEGLAALRKAARPDGRELDAAT
jgi:hypothetical protein